MKILNTILPTAVFLTQTITPQASSDHRIAILHSATSQSHFWSDVSYAHMFLHVQHAAVMSGVPFDVISEEDLSVLDKIKDYDAIVFHSFRQVRGDLVENITSSLETAIADHGLSLIGAGPMMVQDENLSLMADGPYKRLTQFFGLQYAYFQGNVDAEYTVMDGSHVTMQGFETNDVLYKFKPFWFDVYGPAWQTPYDIDVTAAHMVNGVPHSAVHAITTPGGVRHVHFAEEWTVTKGNRIWAAIRFCVFGPEPYPVLAITRDEGLFYARNDMDLTKFTYHVPIIHTRVLEVTEEWKRDYNFVGSYYIVIGDDPENDEETNWNYSAPLYKAYMDLGNEIGTHSYTHPHWTSQLSYEELEFEFNQSARIIEDKLNVRYSGGAVPGNPEPLFVPYSTDPWLRYLAGAMAFDGISATPGMGLLRPGQLSPYILLNMSPDFTFMGFLKKNASESEELWRKEFEYQMVGVERPMYQYLWHDYAPGFEPGFTIEPVTNTIARAYSAGMEFITGEELVDRFDIFRKTKITINQTAVDEYTIDMMGAGYGKFAIAAPKGKKILDVSGWNAWGDDRIMLKDIGRRYVLKIGDTPDPNINRVTKMPMRANLIEAASAGIDNLEVVFEGEGQIEIYFAYDSVTEIRGGDHFSRDGKNYVVTFNQQGTHTLIFEPPLTASNRAPVPEAQTFPLVQPGDSVDIILNAVDPDGNTLSYSVLTQPTQGNLTGIPPNLQYTASFDAVGADSFVFEVSDNALASTATIDFTFSNPAPIVVDGDLTEWADLHSPPKLTVIDPADIVGDNNIIDILQMQLYNDKNDLYISFVNKHPIQVNWGWMLVFDTDNDKSTGFPWYGAGADYLLQGKNIFKYVGTGGNLVWDEVWELVDDLPVEDYVVLDNTSEILIPLGMLGMDYKNSASFNFVFTGTQTAVAGGEDTQEENVCTAVQPYHCTYDIQS